MSEATVWADGLTMLGVPIGVKQEVSDDFQFQLETTQVVDMTNRATRTIVGAHKAGDAKVVNDMVAYFDDLKDSFKNGAEKGWFNPDDVIAFCEVVDKIIANPMFAVKEN